MLRFAIAVALFGACVALNTDLDGHWREYKRVHGKWYSAEEELMRREIFEDNIRYINSHNLRHDLNMVSYRLGLNKFADMTNDEYSQYRGMRINATAVRRRGQLQPATTRPVPKSVDWRKKGYVTPVKNQEQCGSCWAFSTTGSLEGQHFAKTGKLVSLSEQNLVDCSGTFGNQGCNGGIMDQAFEYIKANGGIDTEESYPYKAVQGPSCQFNEDHVGATVSGYVDVPSSNEKALMRAVGSVGPVSVAIDASHKSFQLYQSGVYNEPLCSNQLDHGVLVVGYGEENGQEFWIVKNSWSSAWGEEGYIRMVRNQNNQCGIASMASYPTV